MAGRYTGSYLDQSNGWRAAAILADIGQASLGRRIPTLIRYDSAGRVTIFPRRCAQTSREENKIESYWANYAQITVATVVARGRCFWHFCRFCKANRSVYTQYLQKAVTDYQNEFVELGKLGIVVDSEPVTQKPKKSTSRVDEFRRSALQ
jgi:hypothetical protein